MLNPGHRLIITRTVNSVSELCIASTDATLCQSEGLNGDVLNLVGVKLKLAVLFATGMLVETSPCRVRLDN